MECHKRNDHFKDSSWTIVREASVVRSYAFLDVPDGTLYSVYVHTGMLLAKAAKGPRRQDGL